MKHFQRFKDSRKQRFKDSRVQRVIDSVIREVELKLIHLFFYLAIILAGCYAGAAKSVKIQWQKQTEGNKFYYAQEPLLKLSWTIPLDGQKISIFRLKVSPEDSVGDDTQTQTVEVKETSAQVRLKGSGKYVALVQALDGGGKVIGNSEMYELQFEAMPSLGAPTFVGEGILMGGFDGRAEIRWKPALNIQSYVLSLISNEGRVLKNITIPGGKQNYIISGLAIGKYQVQLQANDQYGRQTPKSQKLWLTIPAAPNLPTPKIKRLGVVE